MATFKKNHKVQWPMALAISLLLLTSCNDYLDVEPRSQIKSDVVYDTENGFKEVLMGVYIDMASSTLYGKNMTMYIPEELAHTWSALTGGVYNYLEQHDYSNAEVESLLSSTYLKYYADIAQLNDLLENLSTARCSFKYNNDKLIRGEALGLRAFLHLDLLRLFGPVPSLASAGQPAIPYSKEVTSDATRLRTKTWNEVVSSIEEDLNEAERILADYDPIVRTSVDSLKSSVYVGVGNVPGDSWQLYRQCRMNYYAVIATKARLYQWMGNTQQATACARRVIDANKLTLLTGSYFTSGIANLSLELYPEHLFGLQNPDFQTIVEPLFKVQTALFTQTAANIDIAYESSVNGNDFRNAPNRYWEDVVWQGTRTVHHFRKYTGNSTIAADNRIPLIRLPEMYLILAEDLPLNEAQVYFRDYRISRAMDSSIDESSFADEASRLDRIEKEYRKEFMGEGQMFYFYKRHNYTSLTWPYAYTMPNDAYQVPLPKGQTNFDELN